MKAEFISNVILSRRVIGGSKVGARDAHPSLGVQILSISCSFWENLTKTYVGAPVGLALPPAGNPGSAPESN